MTKIQLVNHASVLISDQDIHLLSDPWYFGSVFFHGWNLIYENTDAEIQQILSKVTHIWISHEHPDHFSVGFFKKYKEDIKSRGVQILFQKTKDKRVIKFLEAQGLSVTELEYNRKTSLTQNFNVTCLKDGFYDSGLYIQTSNMGILNLNDCEVRSIPRINEIKKHIGTVDLLLTQFSYAAWKGGAENKKWREEAALEKLETIKLQAEHFEPTHVIPFASFVYFSNVDNFYLNDSSNTLKDVEEILSDSSTKVVCMKPMDEFTINKNFNNRAATTFWRSYKKSLEAINKYESCSLIDLDYSFKKYRSRLQKNNNYKFMKILRYWSPIKVFHKVNVRLKDTGSTVCIDLFNPYLEITSENSHLEMHSSMLKFLLDNGFGFDTLTVNGCFTETSKGGFVLATKTLAVENLNNLGISIRPSTLLNLRLIGLFLARLYRVARKLE